jgi:hypothetical protein
MPRPGERNTREAGRRAQAVCARCWPRAGDDPLFQQHLRPRQRIAGDDVRAGEAWAEAAFLGGRPEQALVQLNNLKKRATWTTTRAAGSTRASPPSPRPCWNCAARASSDPKTHRPPERGRARRRHRQPADGVTKPS